MTSGKRDLIFRQEITSGGTHIYKNTICGIVLLQISVCFSTEVEGSQRRLSCFGLYHVLSQKEKENMARLLIMLMVLPYAGRAIRWIDLSAFALF